MKHGLTLVMALAIMTAANVSAQNLTGKKIYINPGHGGYEATTGTKVTGQFANGWRSDGSEATDRWSASIPYPTVTEEGFWESKSNLWRGLKLKEMLENAGATVMMSRTGNTITDDRLLDVIGKEANTFGADLFLSIHSNAHVDDNDVKNYLLCMYRGADPKKGQTDFDKNDPDIPASKTAATTIWNRLIDNHLTSWKSHYDPADENVPLVMSDSAFYGTYHLAVLRELKVPGVFLEASFHDYKPETHRMLNRDYSDIVTYQIFNALCEYFEAGHPSTGVIAGEAKSLSDLFTHDLYYGATEGTHDEHLPVNGAIVTLTGNGIEPKTYVTDNYYNGLFYFPDLEPGTYHIKIVANGYLTYETDVVCEAAVVRGPIAMLERAPLRPNIFASDLRVFDKCNIGFTLNAKAVSVTLNLFENGEQIKQIELGEMERGYHTYTVPYDDLLDKMLTWSLTVTGEEPRTVPEMFTIPSMETLAISNTRGVAIDNNPASKWFGHMYATSIAANGFTGGRPGTGIYILDAVQADIHNQLEDPFAGSISWTGGNNSPMRVNVAPDGQVYISDWSDSHSGVWVLDPENPSSSFRQLFTGGTRASNGLYSKGSTKIHGSITDVAFTGEGESLKMFTVDEDMPSKINRYNLGTNLTWSDTRTAAHPASDANIPSKFYNKTLSPDGRGGIWVGQNRGSSDSHPSLLHLQLNSATRAADTDTYTWDYVCTDRSVVPSSEGSGAMSANVEGNLVAIAGLDKVYVTEATYSESGAVTGLSLKYTISNTTLPASSSPYAIAIDAADNLYVAYNDNRTNGGGIIGYALPRESNTYTTPGQGELDYLTIFTGIGEVEATGFKIDGDIASADGADINVYSMSGTLVAQGRRIDLSGLGRGVFILKAGKLSKKIAR